MWDEQSSGKDNRSIQNVGEKDWKCREKGLKFYKDPVVGNLSRYVVSVLTIRQPGRPHKSFLMYLFDLSPSVPSLLFSVTAFHLPLPPLPLPPPPSLVLAGPLLPPVPGEMLWNQVRLVKTAAGLCSVAREREERKRGRRGRRGLDEGGFSTDWAHGYCVDIELFVRVIHNLYCT